MLKGAYTTKTRAQNGRYPPSFSETSNVNLKPGNTKNYGVLSKFPFRVALHSLGNPPLHPDEIIYFMVVQTMFNFLLPAG